MNVYEKFSLLGLIWDLLLGMGLVYFGARVERYNVAKRAKEDAAPKWYEKKEPNS